MGKQFKVVDLFCGAGGLHMGFEKAGYDIRLCVDNDNLVEKTHKRNFPNIPFINKDIRELSSDEVKKYLDVPRVKAFQQLVSEYPPILK